MDRPKLKLNGTPVETIDERAERMARELLGTTAADAFARLDRDQLRSGSIAEMEFRLLRRLKQSR